MVRFTSYDPGTPSWIALATTDPAAAAAFYADLFGWAAPEGLFLLRDLPVAGLSTLSDEMVARGVPPHWVTYISVDDADAAAARASEAGGRLLEEPRDVGDSGRTATVVDSTGATFALWQPGTHRGSAFANEHGSFTWNELQTHDTAGAGRFYRSVFDWSTQTADMPGGPYTTFMLGDRAVAGMMAIREEWGPVPPNWSVYLAVEDCDEAVGRAEARGGKIEVPAQDIADVGRFALLQDPQGAYFYVLEGM